MNFLIEKMSIMKFFMVFLVLITVSFFLLPYANAVQIDSFMELQDPKSQFTAKYHAIVLVEHEEENKIKEILKDRDWTISKTANANDSESIALATKLNEKIAEDGSNAKISDLSVEYQATLQSENNHTTINYSITLVGTLSNYVFLDSDDLSDSIFVDVNWRGLSVKDPVLIGEYDINSPLSAIIEKEPEVYSLIESHQKIIDLLSKNLIDAENILHAPLSKWYFAYGPMGPSGEILEDTISEFSFDPMLQKDYPEEYTVTETFTVDGDDYVVEIMRPVDSASIRMTEFATVKAPDGTEILEITGLPLDIPQIPNTNAISGDYTNEEFGFSVTLPDNLEGFLTEVDNPNTGKIVNIQIHPEMRSDESCCPTVDTSPIVMLLDSHPKSMLATPVPFTGDMYAAIQGYGMNMSLDTLGELPVLTSTLEYEREYQELPEPIKRVGKFYYVDAGDRYLSYGLLATNENYKKYINEFEESAKSLVVTNNNDDGDATPINLNELFDYPRQMQLILKDDSVINSRVITPSNINSVTLDQKSNSLHIRIDEPNSYRSFLLTNIGEILEEPYVVMFDDVQVDGQILENESGKYMMIYYEDKKGPHEISITGSKVVPEFGTIAAMILAVAIISIIAVSARSRLGIIPRL